MPHPEIPAFAGMTKSVRQDDEIRSPGRQNPFAGMTKCTIHTVPTYRMVDNGSQRGRTAADRAPQHQVHLPMHAW